MSSQCINFPFPIRRVNLNLSDNADNTATLEANDRRHANVTLKGRTLWGDGSWNTICLPFDVADITTTPLHGATIKALLSSDYNEESGTLTLNFTNATTSLSAGTPYIFRWPQPEHYGEEGYSYDKTDFIKIGKKYKISHENNGKRTVIQSSFRGFSPLPVLMPPLRGDI